MGTTTGEKILELRMQLIVRRNMLTVQIIYQDESITNLSGNYTSERISLYDPGRNDHGLWAIKSVDCPEMKYVDEQLILFLKGRQREKDGYPASITFTTADRAASNRKNLIRSIANMCKEKGWMLVESEIHGERYPSTSLEIFRSVHVDDSEDITIQEMFAPEE